MSYTLYVPESSGLNLYLKKLPLVLDFWSTGTIVLTELSTTGQYSATAEEAEEYFVYQRVGVAVSASDVRLGFVPKLITPVDLVKINGNDFTLFTQDDLIDVPVEAELTEAQLNRLDKLEAR